MAELFFALVNGFTIGEVLIFEMRLLDTQSIIAELEAERNRLDQAISALKGNGRRSSRPRPDGMASPRHLSAAARKRISDAQKKKWAARKKAGGA